MIFIEDERRVRKRIYSEEEQKKADEQAWKIKKAYIKSRICSNPACYYARSSPSKCTCSCYGVGHGGAYVNNLHYPKN